MSRKSLKTLLQNSALMAGAVVIGATGFVTGAKADHPPGKGGKLTVAINRDIGGFDLVAIPRGGRQRMNIFHAIYEGLWDLDAKTNKIIPNHGLSAEASDNFKRWRVKFRKGVKFSNGEEMNAHAYKAYFDRIISSRWGARFRNWLGPRMERVDVIDSHTADFIFTQSSPGFKIIMSQPLTNLMVPAPKFVAENKDKPEFNEKVVGAGPYMLKKWSDGVGHTLVRNPHYWNPKGQHLDEIFFMIIPNVAGHYNAMLAGQIDVMGMTRGYNVRRAIKVRRSTLRRAITISAAASSPGTARNRPSTTSVSGRRFSRRSIGAS